MSYEVVEQGLLDVVRLLGSYTQRNSSKSDYRILGTGSDKMVILNPGEIPDRSVASSPRRIRTNWVIDIELVVPWRGEISTIADSIRDARKELLDHIDAYPTLDGTTGVVNAFIGSALRPQHWKGGSRNYWMQTLIVTVEERHNISIAE